MTEKKQNIEVDFAAETKKTIGTASKNRRRNSSRKKNPSAKAVMPAIGKMEEITPEIYKGGKVENLNPNKSKVQGAANKSDTPTVATAITKTKPKRTSSRKKGDLSDCKLKVIPLGGLGEVGKNMMVLEYDDQIIVIDGGLSFPGDELLGIDLVIPDFSYLIENKAKIQGILLTHGHEDHIGAMPYILKELGDVPIYGSRLTLGLLKLKLAEHKIKSTKLFEVVPRQTVNLKPFKIDFIRITHSIPDCLGIAVHTPVGLILYISDFKIDMSPVDNQIIDFAGLSHYGEKGVLALFSDSTNAEKDGFTPSEKTVGEALYNIFIKAQGRVIMTTFASNVHRVQQAVWAAERCERKIAIVGRGMQNVSTIARELGYLAIPQHLLVDISEINKIPAERVLIITTGSQGEPMSGLSRMASGDHRQVQIGKGDTVVISATPIPGNERLVGRTIDNLFRLGANVVHERNLGIHVSGHASREELKMLLNIVKPQFFIPVHGEYRMLYKHALLAQQSGIPEKNTFIMENGQILHIGRKRGMISGIVPSGRILIDGLGIGDVGHAVLKERKQLSEDGIVIVTMVINKCSKKIVNEPEFYSRGFIFEKDYEHIKEDAIKTTTSLYTEAQALGSFELGAFKAQLRTTLMKEMSGHTGRRPIILPLIYEV